MWSAASSCYTGVDVAEKSPERIQVLRVVRMIDDPSKANQNLCGPSEDGAAADFVYASVMYFINFYKIFKFDYTEIER